MNGLLMAGSPVEIEAKADEVGMEAGARTAAAALFHELTSRLELTLLDSPADGGEDWPRHRFWFGPAAEIAAAVTRLRGRPDVAEAPATAAVVFVTGEQAEYAGLLAAGSRAGWVETLGL